MAKNKAFKMDYNDQFYNQKTINEFAIEERGKAEAIQRKQLKSTLQFKLWD